MASSASWPFAGSRAVMTRLQPVRAKAVAVGMPMPLVAPVTMMVLPLRSKSWWLPQIHPNISKSPRIMIGIIGIDLSFEGG